MIDMVHELFGPRYPGRRFTATIDDIWIDRPHHLETTFNWRWFATPGDIYATRTLTMSRVSQRAEKLLGCYRSTEVIHMKLRGYDEGKFWFIQGQWIIRKAEISASHNDKVQLVFELMAVYNGEEPLIGNPAALTYLERSHVHGYRGSSIQASDLRPGSSRRSLSQR